MKVKQIRLPEQAILNENIRVLIFEKAFIDGVKHTAENANINYSTFWNQLNNRTRQIPAYTVILYCLTSGDIRPLAYMADLCGFELIPKIHLGNDPRKTLYDIMTDSIDHLGDAV